MKVEEFKNKYVELQKEAKAIAMELKPLVKRYETACKKASALAVKADYDKQLYKWVPERDDMDTDGWNVRVLSRLEDFNGVEEFLKGARNVLLNLADQPFAKRQKKAAR